MDELNGRKVFVNCLFFLAVLPRADRALGGKSGLLNSYYVQFLLDGLLGESGTAFTVSQ